MKRLLLGLALTCGLSSAFATPVTNLNIWQSSSTFTTLFDLSADIADGCLLTYSGNPTTASHSSGTLLGGSEFFYGTLANGSIYISGLYWQVASSLAGLGSADFQTATDTRGFQWVGTLQIDPGGNYFRVWVDGVLHTGTQYTEITIPSGSFVTIEGTGCQSGFFNYSTQAYYRPPPY